MDGTDSAVERSGSALRVSRWPAAVALLAIGGLYLLVSERLTLGPPWLLLLAIVALLIPLGLARRIRRLELARWIALTAAGAVTIAVAAVAVQTLPEASVPTTSRTSWR